MIMAQSPNQADSVQLKIADIYLAREMTDRASLLQFELNALRSVLVMNGLAASATIGLFQSVVARTGDHNMVHILLIIAAGVFVTGAWQAMRAAAVLGQSRLRFMFTWGSMLKRLFAEPNGFGQGKNYFIVNDPGDTEDNARPLEYHLKLALKFSGRAEKHIGNASTAFLAGLLTVIGWSLLQLFDWTALFRIFRSGV
jgi:hypothetical protein